MGAFNKRLEPTTMFGQPLPAIIAAAAALALLVLTLMLPWALRILSLLGVAVCAGVIGLVYRLGEDLPLRGVMWAARRERNRVTTETRSRA